MIIQYDEGKKNIRKHGISLSAITDPLSIYLYDETHSATEDRWLAIGNSDGRILVVSFTMRGEEYRIISARKATRMEEGIYFNAVSGKGLFNEYDR